MQTQTSTDQLFGEAFQQLRVGLGAASGQSTAACAVTRTCSLALESYLRGGKYISHTYGVRSTHLRSVEMMERIRAELGKLFGHDKVTVHRSESDPFGLDIKVTF
jgi:hypothetical protein